ncbi:MAG: UDP-N-acetylmuramate dehydrogenase [Cyclobacteriaceae bacterium]|nr:UDP-N-acetylmuramate dehydrogenase [Cyclobacteriaceae bacterium]
MQIEENINLKPFNTFGIAVNARYFSKVSTAEELLELTQTPEFKNEKHLILGGGSNILFKSDFDGLIIKTELKGIEVIDESDEVVIIKVQSGELWHDLVLHCVNRQWGGIENLSLIPGTAGASPIQNIGAYGVELKDVLKEVEGIDLTTGEKLTFTNSECAFGYRDSIFKHQLKEKIFISSITLSLTKKNHLFNTSYGAIADTLKAMNVHEVSIQSISDAVIQIRKNKLPDPSQLGNAGSFFKNPVISFTHYQSLQKTFSTIPGYHSVNQEVKVPAGWLIEQCGWKGKRINHVGVHAHQALVIVNYDNATGEEIFDLAQQIISSVKQKFYITLTPEVNII